MAPTLGSSISSPAGSSSAEPLLEAATVVSASDSQSWPLWKWLATGVGIYGGLVLLGWLTKPDPSEEAAAAAKGKGPAAQPGARKGASAPRLNRAQLPQINEQIQELCNHQEFDAAERVVKLLMEQLELELQTTPDPEILLEMFGFQKKLADIYRRSGKLAEAESQLEQLYMEFEQLRAPPVELSLLKQELSGVAEERNNLEKSERLMKEALKLWEQAEGPNSINSWPMIYKLCLFRKHAGALPEAQAYLQKAIQVLELAPRTNTQAQAIIGQLRLEGIDLLMEQDKLEQADAAIDELLEEVVNGSFKAKTPTYIGELGRMWFDHRLYDRAESLLKRGLAFEGLSSSERVELLNDLANVYVESDRSEEALTLQSELKTLPEGAPLTDSRFFKTAEATPENNKYRLLLTIKATTGPKALPKGVLVDAHYEAIEGSEPFTVSKVVDEETLKKKELDLSSEDLDALPALPRFVQVTIWKDDTKSQRLGVHTQLVKRTVPKPLTPFISFATNDEEEVSSSNESSSSASTSAPPPLEDAEQGKEETTGEPVEESKASKVTEGAVGSEAEEQAPASSTPSTQEEAEDSKAELEPESKPEAKSEPEVEAGSEANASGQEEAEEKTTTESESESQNQSQSETSQTQSQVVIEDATEEEDAFEATLASATPDQ